MYTATVYFAGPATRWARQLVEHETLATRGAPWLWLARFWARRVLADLNAGHAGYVITRDGQTVEQHEQGNA